MKKKNIRKYILEALAVLLVIGACLTVNELSRKEAYADNNVNLTVNINSIKAYYHDDTAVEYREATSKISKITITVKKGEETVYTNTNITSSGLSSSQVSFSSAGDGRYTLTVTGCDFSDGTATAEYDTSLTSEEITISGGSTDFSFNLGDVGIVTKTNKPTTVNWTTSGTPKFYYSDGTTECTGLNIGNLTGNIEYKVGGTSQTPVAITNSNPTSFSYTGTGSDFKINLTGCSLSSFDSFKNGKNVANGNLSSTTVTFELSSIEIVTSTQVPTITWNDITVRPTINVNGTRDTSGKTVSEYTYQVVDSNGTALSGDERSNTGTLSGSKTVTGALATRYKLKLTGCKVDGTVYTPTGTIETDGYNESSHEISGTLSPVINVTTKPSEYNKLKAAKVENENDDYLVVSEIDETLRNNILDYVYDNNVNNLKPVIQGIMSRGNELSLKVVAEKIGSSDADGKSDIKDEAKVDGKSVDVLNYYNISVYITEGSSYRYDRSWNVTDTGSSNKLKLKFKVKSGSSSTSGQRSYKVILYHDGDAHSLTDYSTTTPIETKSHKFSTYAVYYYDSSSSSSSSASTPKSNSAIVPDEGTGGAGAGGTDKSKTPKTGDDFNPRIWIYLLIVCATVASAAWILLQDTKDEKKDN